MGPRRIVRRMVIVAGRAVIAENEARIAAAGSPSVLTATHSWDAPRGCATLKSHDISAGRSLCRGGGPRPTNALLASPVLARGVVPAQAATSQAAASWLTSSG